MTLVDLSSEARAAVFEAVAAAAGQDWPVFDTVPENTRPNFLKVAAVDSSNESRPGEQLERIVVDLIGVYQGEDRGVLGAMMFAARRAIDGRSLATGAAMFGQCRFVTGALSDAGEDGITYVALSRFELIGEPA